MSSFLFHLRNRISSLSGPWVAALCFSLLPLLPATAQSPPASPPIPPPLASAQALPAPAEPPPAGSITEEEIRQLLLGKPLYLRSGYLENSLAFSEHGQLIGHSPQGSYTLAAVQIEKVRLTRHKLELEGARYGLHFVGQLAYEDPAKAVDRVRITPAKKALRISIDRELVIAPKKDKARKSKNGGKIPAPAPELDPAEQLKTEIAAAPQSERPAEPASITTTTSPAHAAKLMREALDSVFAPGLDQRMVAALPDFWKLYYQAAAAGADYRPQDPAVLRQSAVDRKARLTSTFEPASNEYAQANAVAGMALYHVVIGPDGKPCEIAVARPIGFGLDENAVDAIRKAKFEPALKDGKPVSVLLDLVVQFRIYSQRTAQTTPTDPAEKDAQPPQPRQLPGPYSVPR
jgi:TonB family protein